MAFAAVFRGVRAVVFLGEGLLLGLLFRVLLVARLFFDSDVSSCFSCLDFAMRQM